MRQSPMARPRQNHQTCQRHRPELMKPLEQQILGPQDRHRTHPKSLLSANGCSVVPEPISQETSKILTIDAVKESDVCITMGCRDTCPVFPGKRYLDWKLQNPAGQGVEAVLPIRDEITTHDLDVTGLFIAIATTRALSCSPATLISMPRAKSGSPPRRRVRACRKCSPPATSSTTPTARPSPLPAPVRPQPWTPSATSPPGARPRLSGRRKPSRPE